MGGDDPERIRRALNFSPLVLLAMLSLWFGLALAFLVAGLSRPNGRPAPAGRKILHVAIFSGAVPAQLALGFWGVLTYGAVLSLLMVGVYWKGAGSGLFESLSNPTGEEGDRRTLPVPFLSTILGGLLGVLLVGQFAIVGYLVCGWGDAAGEIVGRRWGRRRFSAPFSEKGANFRTMEGSLGVFLFGSLGAAAGILLLGFSPALALGWGLICGGCGAGAEALSGHNTDNLWMQIIPALTAWWILA